MLQRCFPVPVYDLVAAVPRIDDETFVNVFWPLNDGEVPGTGQDIFLATLRVLGTELRHREPFPGRPVPGIAFLEEVAVVG